MHSCLLYVNDPIDSVLYNINDISTYFLQTVDFNSEKVLNARMSQTLKQSTV